MKKRVILLLCFSLLLLAYGASLYSPPEDLITGMHHTPLVTGRIIRRDSIKLQCNDESAKILADRLRLWYGCREYMKNGCTYAVFKEFPRQNKAEVDCTKYEEWKLFLASCSRYYFESCERIK